MNVPSPSRSAHLHAVVLLVLTGLAYSWPLVSRLRVSVPERPGFADVSEYVWSVGYTARALSSGASLFQTNGMFVPFGADLRLSTFGLLPSLLASPWTPFIGVGGAYNSILILTLILNGIAGYILAFHLTKHAQASFLSAMLFMLSAPILMHITRGRFGLGAMWLVVGALLAFKKTIDQPGVKNAALLGLLLIGALLTDFQILLFSLLWLLVYGVSRLCRDGRTLLDRKRILSLAIPGSLVLIVFAAIYAPAFSAENLKDYATPGLDDMARNSYSWRDFVRPSSAPYIYGLEFGALVVLAVATFRTRGDYKLWLSGSIIFALLSLGPAGFRWIPALAQFRTPYRLIMPAQIGLMIVAAQTLAHWLPRLRWPLSIALAAGHLWFVSWLQPFVVQNYPNYAFYRQVAEDSEDFALLEIPFGVRSGLDRIGSGGEVVQYYQHIHGKRLLNGSMARVPLRVFEFYRSQPALMFLAGDKVSATTSELDANFNAVLRWSNSRYVLVHPELGTPEQHREFVAFVGRQSNLTPVAQRDGLVVYRVTR